MAVCVKAPVKSHGLERSLQIIQPQPPPALFSSVPLLLNLLRVFGSISNANSEFGYSAPDSEYLIGKIP